jgi:hypothetical protein
MLGVDGGTAQRPWQQVIEEVIELFAAAVLLIAFLERYRFSLRTFGRSPRGRLF